MRLRLARLFHRAACKLAPLPTFSTTVIAGEATLEKLEHLQELLRFYGVGLSLNIRPIVITPPRENVSEIKSRPRKRAISGKQTGSATALFIVSIFAGACLALLFA